MSGSPYDSPQEPSKTYSDGGLGVIFESLHRKRIWMRVLGISAILGGAFYCLTIVGVIIGIPLILGGINLYQAAGNFENAAYGQPDLYRAACENLAKVILMGAIIFLISVAFILLYFAVIIFVAVFSIGGGLQL